MIYKIKQLKNLGIFSNYNADVRLNKFSKFNLFYGWNGCGKTTLSKFFNSLHKERSLPSEFENVEYKIQIDNDTLTQLDLIELENINVFNEEYVKENIDWDNKIESILLISAKKIDEKNKLDANKKINEEKNKKLATLNKYIKETGDKIKKELSKKASEIKNSFQSISPEDKTYFNYDRTKFKNFILDNQEEIKKGSGKLNETELLNLIDRVRPNEKDVIDYTLKKMDLNALRQVEVKVKKILEFDLSVGIIERLKENSDISEWVEKGLKIHEKYSDQKCEFCGNEIDLAHIKKLKEHFSDELEKLRNRIEEEKMWIQTNLIQEEIKIEKELFYKEFQRDFLDAKIQFDIEIEELNIFFKEWKVLLEEKFKNPSKPLGLKKEIKENFLDKYNEKKEILEKTISSHNNSWKNFDEEYKKNQKKLELHYATEFEKDILFLKQLDDINKARLDSETLVEEINALSKTIFDLTADLSNEELGAEEFNKNLAKFISHSEIELKFNPQLKGYEVYRPHHEKKAKNLSEGEKTAIAFIFFLIKLKEKSQIQNEIVIIDDPISSFDSNNLFSAYSYIKADLENAKQLFVLTHNFTFFRLIRDWFKGKNKKSDIKSSFFQIDILPKTPRESAIKNIPETLLLYNSEYHFVFSKLYSFNNYETLDLEKSFQVANLSRKLLESFLSFKFPKKRNDFRALINSVDLDVDIEEKIYRFINKYSHLPLEDYENSENNLIGESDNIISNIFEIVENLDKKHYDEMVSISNNSTNI